MFKYSSIKRYGKRLHPKLVKRFGEKKFYSSSQIRSTVYQCDFNPEYLPLGYLLFLEKNASQEIITLEFPQLCLITYKKNLLDCLKSRDSEVFSEVLAL